MFRDESETGRNFHLPIGRYPSSGAFLMQDGSSRNSIPSDFSPDNHVTIDWDGLRRIIHDHRSFLLTTHIRPDCDAIGSTLALSNILRRLHKETVCLADFEVPPNLRFLDPTGEIHRLGHRRSEEWRDSVEVLVVLDTSAWAQLGGMADFLRAFPRTKIVLDHHVSGDDLGAQFFKDTRAEATGRIVAELAEKLEVPLDPATAKLLLAALATDTGWFRFNSVRADTFSLGARLVAAGVRPDELYRELYENERIGRFRLTGRAMQRAETELDGRLIHTYLVHGDFAETGALSSDSEDIVNTTLTVSGTQLAFILVEHTPGRFKISFRSRCHVDCSRLAAEFGGGGHKAAAGATVLGTLDDARAKVLDAARKALQQ